MNAGSTLNGRALAQTAVTLNAATVTVPTTSDSRHDHARHHNDSLIVRR